MNKVLYEISFKFEFMLLVPVVMMIYMAVFPKIWKKGWEGRHTIISYKDVKLFCFLACCCLLIMLVIVGGSQIRMYQKTVGAYKSGNYSVIEGYVENYDPVINEDHGKKSFEIHGVKFSFAEHSSQPGYNDTKSDGGVIIGDGQHLKIGYVYYNRIYGNVIVYIEQLS